MKYALFVIVSLAYFGLIGFACWITSSAWPLLLMVFAAPSINIENKTND